MPAGERFTIIGGMRAWFRTRLQHGSMRAALREFASEMARFLNELRPIERRACFGDIDYDFEHEGADTTRSNVSLRTQLLARLYGSPYYASEPYLFDEIMHALPIERGGFAFVDLGSGKGRTLLMAAEAGFGKVIGVELMPELHQIAQRNIAALGSRAESFCMDAREFEFPPVQFVLYLFNPFPEAVMKRVMANLENFLAQHPREVYVAYRYPELEAMLAQSPALEKIDGTEQWVVYRAT